MPTNEARKVDSWDEEVTDVAPKQVDSWDEEVVDEPVKKKVTPSPSQTQSEWGSLDCEDAEEYDSCSSDTWQTSAVSLVVLLVIFVVLFNVVLFTGSLLSETV